MFKKAHLQEKLAFLDDALVKNMLYYVYGDKKDIFVNGGSVTYDSVYSKS